MKNTCRIGFRPTGRGRGRSAAQGERIGGIVNDDPQALQTLRAAEVLGAVATLRTAARRWSADWSAAEDLLQDTLERAFRTLDSYRQGTSAGAWMRTIMYRLAVDETRRERRERKVRHRFVRECLPVVQPLEHAEDVEPPAPTRAQLGAAALELREPFRTAYRHVGQPGHVIPADQPRAGGAGGHRGHAPVAGATLPARGVCRADRQQRADGGPASAPSEVFQGAHQGAGERSGDLDERAVGGGARRPGDVVAVGALQVADHLIVVEVEPLGGRRRSLAEPGGGSAGRDGRSWQDGPSPSPSLSRGREVRARVAVAGGGGPPGRRLSRRRVVRCPLRRRGRHQRGHAPARRAARRRRPVAAALRGAAGSTRRATPSARRSARSARNVRVRIVTGERPAARHRPGSARRSWRPAPAAIPGRSSRPRRRQPPPQLRLGRPLLGAVASTSVAGGDAAGARRPRGRVAAGGPPAGCGTPAPATVRGGRRARGAAGCGRWPRWPGPRRRLGPAVGRSGR